MVWQLLDLRVRAHVFNLGPDYQWVVVVAVDEHQGVGFVASDALKVDPSSQASRTGDFATITLRRALGPLAFGFGICRVLITLPVLAL
jgi:hypothetical protein